MRRTEFLLLARAMRSSKPPQHSIPAWQQWLRDCSTIAEHIKEVNPAFDVMLFLANCKEPE